MHEKYLNKHKNNEEKIREYLNQRRHELSMSNIKTALHLTPTIACFGECSYCYNKTLLTDQITVLSPTNLDKRLKEVSSKATLDFDLVRFYGGEPALASKHFVDYINTILKYSEIKTLYISSGLLFDNYVFKVFLNHLNILVNLFPDIDFVVGTTTDFGYTMDNYTRKCMNFEIELDTIFNRAKQILKTGASVKFNNIITRNVDSELFRDQLLYALTKFGFDVSIRIVFSNDNDLYPKPELCDKIMNVIKDLYEETYFYNVYSMFEYLGDEYGKSNCGKYTRLDKDGNVIGSAIHCGIFSSLLTINHEGKIVSCHYKMDEETDELTESKHFDFMVNLRDKCIECDYLTLCCGDCVMRHRYQNEEADDAYCYWIKKSIELSFLKNKLIRSEDER